MMIFPINRMVVPALVCATSLSTITPAMADDTMLDPIVVTATREAKPQSEVAESVAIIDREEIEFVSPSHPSELLNRQAGVLVNNLGGEGHMTAIRQPLTTGGVYLFLEDGIPTRPTGLFNHNALYEINVPQADRIEIIKGPGSALYGSDSIGGIINTITKPAPDESEASISVEGGSFGYRRALGSVGAPINDDHSVRLDLNVTDNDGFRDESEYQRKAVTARGDGFLSDDLSYKTVLSFSQVDQSGVSGLEDDDYRNNTTKNRFHNDVGRREVEAFRASTEFSYEPDATSLYTITPFFRHNSMKLMPSWMLDYDANDRDTEFQSYGMLAKYRVDIPDYDAEFVTGVDVDYTPSSYREQQVDVVRDGDIITDTTFAGRTNYDFDADQLSVSPYVHGEWQAHEKVRLTGGLRYDYFHVDYQDNLDGSVAEQQRGRGGFTHRRPASQDVSYDSFSPKLGVVVDVDPAHDVYANYRHSFRVPSIGQLFRSGSSIDTDQLEPVKNDSFEIGLRGQIFGGLRYDAALYHMIVRDDVVSFIDNVSGDRRVTNAGETQHQGAELALSGNVTDEVSFSTAWSVTNQTYEDYTALFGFPTTQVNYAGNDVGKAPRTLGNLAVQYQPSYVPDMMVEAEWQHVGDYYTDETNTQDYAGHNLFNVRGTYDIDDQVQLFGRVLNVTDKLYSVYTSNQVGDPDIQYRPGLPRTFYVGVRAAF